MTRPPKGHIARVKAMDLGTPPRQNHGTPHQPDPGKSGTLIPTPPARPVPPKPTPEQLTLINIHELNQTVATLKEQADTGNPQAQKDLEELILELIQHSKLKDYKKGNHTKNIISTDLIHIALLKNLLNTDVKNTVQTNEIQKNLNIIATFEDTLAYIEGCYLQRCQLTIDGIKQEYDTITSRPEYQTAVPNLIRPPTPTKDINQHAKEQERLIRFLYNPEATTKDKVAGLQEELTITDYTSHIISDPKSAQQVAQQAKTAHTELNNAMQTLELLDTYYGNTRAAQLARTPCTPPPTPEPKL